MSRFTTGSITELNEILSEFYKYIMIMKVKRYIVQKLKL